MTKARDIASAAPAPSTVSATELGYLDGVTSAVQTQIDSKQAANANVSTTELGYLDGVTSAIQTQLDGKVAASIVDAKGDIIAGTAADTVSKLSVGANDTVLTADSSTATGLKWAAAAGGGGMTLLSTTSLSGASTTISSISGSYNKLELHLNDFYNDTAGYTFKIYFNSDTTDGNYFSGKFRSRAVNEGITFDANPIVSAFGLPTSQQNTYMFISMPNYSTTNMRKQFIAQNTGVSDTGEASTISLGAWKNDSAITSITLSNTAGNWGAGTAYLYGVK